MDSSVVSSQTWFEDVPNVSSNEVKHFNKKNSTKHLEVTNYIEEEERLNVDAWEYFNDLTDVVKKIDRLNDIMIQIQESLMLPATSKSEN